MNLHRHRIGYCTDTYIMQCFVYMMEKHGCICCDTEEIKFLSLGSKVMKFTHSVCVCVFTITSHSKDNLTDLV